MTTVTTIRTEAAGSTFHGDSVFHLQEVKSVETCHKVSTGRGEKHSHYLLLDVASNNAPGA
jgi:hypothetical protein